MGNRSKSNYWSSRFGTYSQHITGGLGASADFKWLQKRWFNPPEINLLTLKSRQIN